MESRKLARNYNSIAAWWAGQMKGSDYGMTHIRKAMNLAKRNGRFLDIGCGSSGRVIEQALENRFEVTGIDLSDEMINIARESHPGVTFINEDFIEWNTPVCYDLIIAWDSTFHAPQKLQEHITRKMCELLTAGGILLFTAGGREGGRSGEMAGVPFEYGSLHFKEYLSIIEEMGCDIIVMERDQYPLEHMVFICHKT